MKMGRVASDMKTAQKRTKKIPNGKNMGYGKNDKVAKRVDKNKSSGKKARFYPYSA